MKIQKKYMLFGGLAPAIIIILIAIINSGNKENLNINESPSPSANPSESPLPTDRPTPTTKVENKKPGIIFEETRDYDYWFSRLDPEARVIAVYDECAYLVPSNVTYKNNTLIMLDNTRSKQAQVLKIGNTEYSLAAETWNTVTLSSPTVPANLQIFCKGVEMGQIDLE